MSDETRLENIHFLEYAIERVVMAAGGSREHARCVAQAIGFAHIQMQEWEQAIAAYREAGARG